MQENIGTFIQEKDIQWCITVPAIWNDNGKATMCEAMQMAGLVCGPNSSKGSPHEVLCVLEPEAASMASLKELEAFSSNIDKPYIVVDVGGGTVDIVVHKKQNSDGELKVRRTTGSPALNDID